MTAKEEQLQERLDVVLALALDRPQTVIPCPDEEELVAWHEKELTDSRRDELVVHLASCNICYTIWSELAEVTELPQFMQEPVAGKGKNNKSSILAKIAYFLRPRSMAIGGFGAAVAAMLIFVLLPTIRMNAVDRNLESSFSSLSLLLPSQPKGSKYQSKALSFSQIISPIPESVWHPQNPQQQVFAVGVLEGMRTLNLQNTVDITTYAQLPDSVTMKPVEVQEKVWLRRQNALRYAGRWAVVLASACEQPALFSTSFWDGQESILYALNKEIAAYPDSDSYTLFFDSWARQNRTERDMCSKGEDLIRIGMGR